ncbi:ML domain-containing protein [Lyophyllum atratum]|nr:ML domain-containing protein [Lyophyllum atratum]
MVRISLVALFRSTAPDAALTTEKWDWKDCGGPSDPIQVESIEVYPDPPQPGKELTVKVKGKATELIEEGAYADVIVKLGLVKLLQKRFDVCDEARNANASVQCPVEPASYIVEQTVALPKEIPRAKFTVNIRGYTVDEDPMLCLDLHVDFMKNPFPDSGGRSLLVGTILACPYTVVQVINITFAAAVCGL